LLVKAKEKKRKNEADPSIEPESERRSVWIFAGSEHQENDAPLKMSEAYLSLLKSLSPLNLLVT